MSTPSPAKLFNVFLDSDGPVADYDKALTKSGLTADQFKHIPGTYLWLDVTAGASTALEALKELDDQGLIRVWIATKTPSKAPYAYTEKALWYANRFPWLEDRLVLAHDKHLLGTEVDHLLDDRPHKGNAKLFKGTFTYFDVQHPEKTWSDFVQMIKNKVKAMEG